MTQPEPVVDIVTPTLAAIRDRWVTTDRWGPACGEHRVLDDHHVLEGLRHARADVRVLLDRLDAYERLETAFAWAALADALPRTEETP